MRTKQDHEKIIKASGGKGPFISEKLLQFIWQFQYFNLSALTTTAGEQVQILNSGQPNPNQGPDFLNAQVRIGPTLFAGSVEIHCKTSQWEEHGHSSDENYKNVILHVVYDDDAEGPPNLPVLELESRISNFLLDKYQSLMDNKAAIPCSAVIGQFPVLQWEKWKERLLAERLLRKSEGIAKLLEEKKFHWEEVFWWMLARNFGSRVNSDAFESIARSLPLHLLSRHRSQIHQLEALLLGQANLLNGEFSESYPKLLSREYHFLRKKYGLKPIHLPIHFLRMRPGNFPTLRLAQLAMLLHEKQILFPEVLETRTMKEMRQFFSVHPNDYWLYHYMPDEISTYKKKNLGQDAINNIITNTVIPILFTYGLYHGNDALQQRAVLFLQETGAEENHVTRQFIQLGVTNKSAADSQALIELKSLYCDQQRCLECAIGFSVLKTDPFT